MNDGPDGDIYCRTCYAAKFGMKGYGFGQGAGTLLSVWLLNFFKNSHEFLTDDKLIKCDKLKKYDKLIKCDKLIKLK